MKDKLHFSDLVVFQYFHEKVFKKYCIKNSTISIHKLKHDINQRSNFHVICCRLFFFFYISNIYFLSYANFNKTILMLEVKIIWKLKCLYIYVCFFVINNYGNFNVGKTIFWEIEVTYLQRIGENLKASCLFAAGGGILISSLCFYVNTYSWKTLLLSDPASCWCTLMKTFCSF